MESEHFALAPKAMSFLSYREVVEYEEYKPSVSTFLKLKI